MISLNEITIKEFKKEIYRQYIKLFPATERKSYHMIKRMAKKGIAHILKIKVQEKTVGFFIVNIVNYYVQIDYFAIFEEYQNKGYGSSALQELKVMYANSLGIFIEIEKVGLGKTKEENELRERRWKFYQKAGFESLNFDLLLFHVIYIPCCLQYKDKDNIEQTKEILFNFYRAAISERMINKYCKVI